MVTTKIPEVKIIEPTVFEDGRGFFFESFNHKKFEEEVGYNVRFVQDNFSKSNKDVLRGLHYQIQPKAQGKLIYVAHGEIFDVAVDIRKNSKTHGHWVGTVLSSVNKRQLWIPEGFAHGFLTMSDEAKVIYKVTEYYHPKYERSVSWDDSSLKINWPIQNPILSNRDLMAKPFLMADYA
ncbi:dTDP-4-dehydrorhamnose 3,5-epimerase [Spartinivicinus ruber]|uniref:dTDP-4-dehydrorhamnose 3,5-epimerase n=1 Tax=Spartinivicinus ruber TaxID=2683272 RepID=UPI002E360457|nr:dTDP-4-dehydrorhamnose 3,5-epimerase [Spartinivicinus ruber]